MDTKKIQNLIDQLGRDVDKAEDQLAPLLKETPEALSERQSGPKRAVPYAVTAYALSSLLFAYYRSVGRDATPVLTELDRVKTCLAKFDKFKPEPKPEPTKAESKVETDSESEPEKKIKLKTPEIKIKASKISKHHHSKKSKSDTKYSKHSKDSKHSKHKHSK